jgi:hypothetical protein
MTGPEYPEALPPEVPEEFAAAYREAYRRALETGRGVDDPSPDAPAPQAAEPDAVADDPAMTPAMTRPAAADVLARWRGSRWFVPAAVAVGAVVLVGAAYAVGTTFSGHDQPGSGGTMAPQASRTTDSPRSGSAKARPTREATAAHGWTGPVRRLGIDAIAADCTAPPGTDAAGRTVTYVPENATDGRPDTAWRCDGTAVGERLVLRLSRSVDVGEVGLVPGYAKTDPASGADRYAENNRITRVRWTLGDGTTVVQRLDPDPSSRAPQLIRVPRTSTDTITLEILAVQRGPRDTTAISELTVAAAG